MKRCVRNSSLVGSFTTAPSYIRQIFPGSCQKDVFMEIEDKSDNLKFSECNGHGIQCPLINWV